jgi:hypothetical protein
MLSVRTLHSQNHKTDFDKIWLGVNSEICGRNSVVCIIDSVSVHELLSEYIHVLKVVIFQFIIRPTNLASDVGELLAVTGQNKPKFYTEAKAQSFFELWVYRNKRPAFRLL